jgi:uncharacterized protein YyaL (SSP411 family)
MKKDHKNTNKLIEETSPYLLQHAHNPVDWHPWHQETLNKAQEEDKPLLISIGYAACHWCHVMAHESFEDEDTAAIMNDNFVCVKVDREERPDIDQIYMEAVQAMTGSGGWPLHCFALPDGKPFYGGTYFPKENWKKLLHAISREYRQNKQKLINYAGNLMEGISSPLPIHTGRMNSDFSRNKLRNMVAGWKMRFDRRYGGENRAPKFPMPMNLSFLLDYAILAEDSQVMDHIQRTLQKMATGGIYDQVGGGFARYSTDIMWKVPHFEKMLYDNAQLIPVYSRAYQAAKNPLYDSVVKETIGFLMREMKDPEGIFYSSLDADSEGVEGKFYVWGKDELKGLLGADYEFAKSIYKLNQDGYWEDGKYILMLKEALHGSPEENSLPDNHSRERISRIKNILFQARESRTRPGLDDKSLTSWNGLVIKALSDAYRVFRKQEYVDAARETAVFILNNLRSPDGELLHSYKAGKAKIHGFLEDYAFLIEGLLALYQATFEETWVREAENLTNYALKQFYNAENGFFYFTDKDRNDLITRKFELIDGVIPSSNSTMAKNLFMLSRLVERTEWETIALEMLAMMEEQVLHNAGAFSKWASLYLTQVYPFYEVAILGPEALESAAGIDKLYRPNILLTGSPNYSDLPILKNRFREEKTLIYVCRDKVCNQPVEDVAPALEVLDTKT